MVSKEFLKSLKDSMTEASTKLLEAEALLRIARAAGEPNVTLEQEIAQTKGRINAYQKAIQAEESRR